MESGAALGALALDIPHSVRRDTRDVGADFFAAVEQAGDVGGRLALRAVPWRDLVWPHPRPPRLGGFKLDRQFGPIH